MKKLIISASLLAIASLPFSAVMAAYKVANVSNGGTITGKVTFSGDDPDPIPYTISKDESTCDKGRRLIDYVVVNKGALTNVVVYLENVMEGKAFNSTLDAPVIDQKDCIFKPFISIMRDGDRLKVLNSDPVLHNIHTYELLGKAKRTLFNISQPPELKEINKPIKLRRGTAIKLECDAHDFMHGFVFVAKSPYYAIVNDDGTFTIDQVPSGDYKIRAWHGTLREKKGKISIPAGGKATIDFEF
jgi:hypothetical protein